MSFFITNGLGDNTLLTNGLGGATVVIVNPKLLERTQGSGVGNYHKKRVKGIELRNENTLLLIKPIEFNHWSITRILKFLKLDASNELLIRQMLKKMEDNTSKIDMTVFKSTNNKLVAKQHFMHMLDGSLSFNGEKFLSFVEKQITIVDKRLDKKDKETKHINVTDTIDNIEVAELMNIIKDMEDTDDI